MSKAFHTRVITLSWFDGDIPKSFTSAKQRQEYLAMVGRMALYGMADSTEDTVDTVTLSPRDDDEVVGVYYAKGATYASVPGSWGSNTPVGNANNAVLDAVRKLNATIGESRPMVIGAINSGGEWGYHS